MPPFGVFASEFLILTTAMQRTPLGDAVPADRARRRVRRRSSAACSRWCLATPSCAKLPHSPALVPVFVHLLIVLMLGLYIPPALAQWYRLAAALIG